MMLTGRSAGSVILLATVLLIAGCSEAPEEPAVPDDTDLSEDAKMDEGAETLEEAADKAMQIEIDSLNNIAPEAAPAEETAANDGESSDSGDSSDKSEEN